MNYLSTQEVADALKRSKKAILHLVARGQLKALKPSPRRLLFKPEDIRDFAEGK